MNIISDATDLLKRAFKKGEKEERESLYEEMWEQSWQERRQVERQWQINMAFYAGNQYIGWNTRLMGIQELKAPSHRILVVDNRLYPKVRSKISRQMGIPGVQVVPDSKAEMDLKRAGIKEKILSHIERENDMNAKRYSLSLWAAVCGSAFTDVAWREEGGAIYRDGAEEFAEGEVRIKIRSPWEIWPAPDAKIGTWGSWCWVAELMDIDVIKDEYDLDDVKSDGDQYFNPFMKSKMYGFFDQGGNQEESTARYQNQALVKRLWIFPTKKNPEGAQVIVINDKEIKRTTFEWFPLTHYQNLPYYDRFWGDTELRQCIPLQKQRNRTRSSIAEYLRTMVKGKYVSHKTNKLGQSSLNTEHLEIVQWEGSGPEPHQMALQSLPSDVWQELLINDKSMDDIYADRPSSQGKQESGVNSGRMVHLLQEEDDRQHTPTISLYEQCLTGTYEKCLEVASEYYDDGKAIMVIGSDKQWDFDIIKRNKDEHGNFAGDDLLGGRNRVFITLGSSLPANKTLRASLIMERYQAGLYGNPQDPIVRRKILKQLDDGMVDDVFDDTKMDETRAMEENMDIGMMQDGQVPKGPLDPQLLLSLVKPPAPYENHIVHMMIHNRFRKSADYYKLAPQQRLILDTHCQMTEQLIREQMAPPPGAVPEQAATPEGTV